MRLMTRAAPGGRGRQEAEPRGVAALNPTYKPRDPWWAANGRCPEKPSRSPAACAPIHQESSGTLGRQPPVRAICECPVYNHCYFLDGGPLLRANR
jgi:hypothetical protein